MGRRPSLSIVERRARRTAVDDPEVVMDAAGAFLSARPRSIAEVRRRLRQHGYRADLVETVVGRLIEMGYLDDAAFARAWVASRDRARPRGERALRQELIQKGIDRETIDAVLGERAEDAQDVVLPEVGSVPSIAHLERSSQADETAARRLLERRKRSLMREPDPARRREKAYALLARNGFDPEVCRAAASAFVGR